MGMKTQERVRRHRDAKRKAGFRLLQIWVPDTRNPKFAAEYRRQAALAASIVDPEEDAFLNAALDDLLENDPPYDWGDGK